MSDRTGRRKAFVVIASAMYGAAVFFIAAASSFNGFLVGMAVAGLGFGMYITIDLALVVDMLKGWGLRRHLTYLVTMSITPTPSGAPEGEVERSALRW